MVGRLAEIVSAAHALRPAAVVHRDLKPANILVSRDRNGKITFRVTDFGLGGLSAKGVIKQNQSGQTSHSEYLATVARGRTRRCTPRRSRCAGCRRIRETTSTPWA